MSVIQIFSVVGALLILSAYGANHLGYMGPERRIYSIVNLFGSTVLAIVAAIEKQWGFLLLEGVWALISAWSFVRLPNPEGQSD